MSANRLDNGIRHKARGGLNMRWQTLGSGYTARAVPAPKWLAAVGLAFSCCSCLAFAQQLDAGVTVTAWGQAMARPQAIELHVKVTGKGQLGTDALARFHQYQRELAKMVSTLGPESVKVHTGGIAITLVGIPEDDWESPAPTDQQAVAELAVSSICRITIAGLDKLSEEELVELTSTLVDKLRDSGLTLLPAQEAMAIEDEAGSDIDGSLAVVGFVLQDLSEPQASARESAFKRAKARAEALAKLAGMRLGPVVAVQEISSGVDLAESPYVLEAEHERDLEADAPGIVSEASHGRLVTRTSGPVAIQVGLQVRFALLPPDNDVPQAGQAAGELIERAQAAAARSTVSTGSEIP